MGATAPYRPFYGNPRRQSNSQQGRTRSQEYRPQKRRHPVSNRYIHHHAYAPDAHNSKEISEIRFFTVTFGSNLELFPVIVNPSHTGPGFRS